MGWGDDLWGGGPWGADASDDPDPNLSFEIENVQLAGYPASWTVSFSTFLTRATFGPAVGSPVDDFEFGWFGTPTFAEVVEARAIFDVSATTENFADGWPASNAGFALIQSSLGTDNFTTDWPSSNDLTPVEFVFVLEGLLVGNPERFAPNWPTTNFPGIEIGDALFGTSNGVIETSGPTESFFYSAPQIFTVDVAADRLVISSHAIPAGQSITVVNDLGFLPSGLLEGVKYDLINVNVDDFQLTIPGVGGSPIVTIDDNGAGTHRARRDEAFHWVDGAD